MVHHLDAHLTSRVCVEVFGIRASAVPSLTHGQTWRPCPPCTWLQAVDGTSRCTSNQPSVCRGLQNSSLVGTIPSSWSRLTKLEYLLLNNNNLSDIDPRHLPTSLQVLTLSCQDDTIYVTHGCRDPPGLNTTSLLSLNGRSTKLRVIDVQNTTSIFNMTSVWNDQ